MGEHTMRERGERLVRFFEHAPMKRTFGMTLSFDDEGNALFSMPNRPEMHHALGDTHGGVIATLLDNAGWFTAATRYDCWVNTSELTVRLHEPARQEDLVGTGRVVRAGKRLCVVEMKVRSTTGRLIATGSGSFMVSSRPLELPS